MRDTVLEVFWDPLAKEKPDRATGQISQGRKVVETYWNMLARARKGILVQFITVGSGLVSQIRHEKQVYATENKLKPVKQK